MFQLRYKSLPESATVEQKLDVSINRASLAYHIVWLSTDMRGDGLPSARYRRLFNDRLLRLVYLGDARARCDEGTYVGHEKVAYVGPVKEGFQRLGRYVSGSGGHEASRFLTSQVELQAATLRDALDRFADPETLHLRPAEYAELVAKREIAKDRIISQRLVAASN